MNQHSEASNLTINVNGHLSIDQSCAAALRQLLEELASVAGLRATTMCVNLYFLPHDQIGPAVNQLVGVEAYPAGEYTPSALIVPHVDESGLTSRVFIDRRELEGFSESSRPDSLVLSLLEEFLHAWVYFRRWEQEGKASGINDSNVSQEQIIAARVHDEYVVCRMKNVIAITVPLFDAPNKPGYRTTRVLQYGGNVGALITDAEYKLGMLLFDYAKGRLSLSQLQSYLLSIIFRLILDPLARSHAFLDGLVEQEQDRFALEQLQQDLYLEQVNPYWQRIYTHLCESYDAELQYMSLTIESISQEIRLLLSELESQVRYSDAY